MARVLIVDDAAFMRVFIRNILTRNGHEVCGEAENGEVAVRKYLELKPDVVAMDITMPVRDGMDCLKEIQQYDPNAKVIMISAMGQEKMVIEAVRSGAKGFILKPFGEDVMLSAINGVI